MSGALESLGAQSEPLTGGRLNAAISTEIVKLHSEFYGKGPTKARTYTVDDVVVTVLRNIFTTVEKTLVEVDVEAEMAVEGFVLETPSEDGGPPAA